MNSKQNHSVRTASVQVNILIVSAAIWVIALAASFNGAPSKPAASNVNDTVSPRAVCDPELSLADRVAYQYAIEEVYWRHRIWPNENGRPKPLLDEMTSHAQMQEKVERALRHSNLLAEEGRAITRDQLQAEMERMARQTKQPEMLNELFSVLNNDPGLIAECLVRPILSDRLIRDLDSHDQKSTAQVNDRTKSNLQARLSAEGKRDYLPPDVVFSSASCPGDTWTPTSTVGAPSARARHTVVWTGSEMIVWGGESSFAAVNTGGRYNPSTDSWSATATTNAPSVREYHTAVWTGGEMIVWAGEDFTDNTGGRYNPITDSWVATSTSNAPSARDYHTAVWTGNEMIVWGGFGGGTAPLLNSGGRYNPSTDSWTATSTIGAPAARFDHTAVWTGSEMIVWGGAGGLAVSNSGGRYNPNTNSWVPTTTTNAPGGRQWHTALWTGSEMIVWGGYFNTILSDGGRYNPSTNSWIATAMANAPIIILHTAVWTGGEMIVWGGEDANNFNVNIGGRYSPFTDSWVATSTTSAPIGREMHSAIWTGSEMIVWGGETYAQEFQYNDTGGSYCAQGPFPTPPPTPTPGGSPTPTSTPSPTPSVSPTPSPTPVPTPTPAPSPTPFFCTILYQNFDYATTPNLPPGWTTSYTPGAADCTPNGTCPFGGNWVTTKDNPYSGPISAFHDAPACVTDSVMNTPTFSLPSSCPLFASFVHSFNLESGHDGAVLEISINGGPFVDIVSAGGSVNYNGTISTGSLSPIAGRPAWTGNSGGYVGAGITFPSAARGQQVALRFRLATDCAGGGEGMGWYIDVIYIWWNCESCFISPTPSPTPAATPSPTLAPTATPAVAGVSGSILSCSNSSPGPVPSVTLSLTGSASGSTLSDANGNYMFSSLIVGGSYTVTPSKAALSPGAAGINTVDVLAVQRHYLGVALLGGCRLTSADVNGDASVTTIDVIAIQRFYLGLSTGVANVGKYQFNPASRSYPNLVGNQTNQNYDTLIFGDAAPPFVAP